MHTLYASPGTPDGFHLVASVQFPLTPFAQCTVHGELAVAAIWIDAVPVVLGAVGASV